uniref:Sialidase domain-containing protein n=1 Tax=Pyramimonas obovata TaxID=1411642 RepID=A0A7S0QUV7_9CHLO|mmetsp:Transcript_21741/g.47757  ORF Transcript_21741/g.47757 Transcript_21741/m.47757 type:complete len:638 (+) Transcript_21741:240-2153(+)|eukprot:CAMPEP_0118946846 /NCGR_PEP_ID=MMETSP1169-20130426/44936_1 /TAXON_ID=36882 /ORGANISM="Pyramimonas obovata, Strain CCMP722" /LENGTH=637 /DNA_ID=CAMNT_0006892927 /DNA_START=173 /DNA_END=2086 /DNA_ORIENTATION=-
MALFQIRRRTVQVPPVTPFNALMALLIVCCIVFIRSSPWSWSTHKPSVASSEALLDVPNSEDIGNKATSMASNNLRSKVADVGRSWDMDEEERSTGTHMETVHTLDENGLSGDDLPIHLTHEGEDDVAFDGSQREGDTSVELRPPPPPPQESDCKMNFAGLSHKEKLAFFESHPECNYLNSCEAILEPTDQVGLVKEVHSTYVFRYNEDIRYSHMAMVERLPNRLLIAAWQAAPSAGNDTKMRLGVEGLDSQHILISHSRDERGQRWSAPQKVPLRNSGALWSPVLHVDDRGVVWLFYSESRLCRKAVACKECKYPPCELKDTSELCHTDPPLWVPGGDIKVVSSVGEPSQNVWTSAQTILSQDTGGGIAKVISNRVTVLVSGEWLLPYWREQAKAAIPTDGCGRDPMSNVSGCVLMDGGLCMTGTDESAGVLISADRGATWQAHGAVVSKRTTLIEGSLVQLTNHSIFMVFRTTTGCLFSSISKDKGLTWSEAQPMGIPNPNSKVHMLKLEPGGQLLLAFNNHRPPGAYRGLKACKACRSRLHLALSSDSGDSWRHVYSVDDEMSSSAVRLHYPCLVQVGSAPMVALVYSRFYLGRKLGLTSLDQGVRYTLLDMSELLAQRTGFFGSLFGQGSNSI